MRSHVGSHPDGADGVQVVRAQLDAYNARDIDAFMQCWHADAEIFAFPDEPVALGAAAIKERHILRFKDEALNCEILGRFAVDDVVVDRELVTRTFPEGIGQVDVLAIYTLRDGLIRKAWFKQGPVRLLESA
jgi:hypothetical protein